MTIAAFIYVQVNSHCVRKKPLQTSPPVPRHLHHQTSFMVFFLRRKIFSGTKCDSAYTSCGIHLENTLLKQKFSPPLLIFNWYGRHTKTEDTAASRRALHQLSSQHYTYTHRVALVLDFLIWCYLLGTKFQKRFLTEVYPRQFSYSTDRMK